MSSSLIFLIDVGSTSGFYHDYLLPDFDVSELRWKSILFALQVYLVDYILSASIQEELEQV